jgi:LacI family transcriptional regulator
VTIDNYRAGYEATQHLIDQGCKRVVHITSNLRRNVYAQRYKGYLAALKENNIPFDENLVFINDLKKESCIALATQIAEMNPLPDGIFATNDLIAALCIQVLKEKGIRIPEDIAVVGFNNDIISIIIEPKLTTINYPGMDIGEVAATHLINQLRGNATNNTSSIVLKSELIIRASSQKK